jgi:DNA-binding transcriptional LysR family regulator
MKFNNVKYFLALCEERNFTRAARRCGIAQPTLTNSIKRLENLFGGALFHRTRNVKSETKLTALALAIKPHLRRAYSALDTAHGAAKKHQRSRSSKSRG